MSKREENTCEWQKAAYLASSDLASLNRVVDQLGWVVGSQWHVACVMRSCVCLCEWVSVDVRRTLHHEAASAV